MSKKEQAPWEGVDMTFEERIKAADKIAEKEAKKDQEAKAEKLKEELFCQLYVKYCGDGRRALSESGLKFEATTINYHLTALMKRDDIAARIEALREFLAVQNNLSEQHVVGMLMRTYEAAMAANKFDAAERCAKDLGEYLGMFKKQDGSIKPPIVLDDTKIQKDIERYSKAAGLEIKTKGNA